MKKQEEQKKQEQGKRCAIPAPKFEVATFTIIGTSPYVQNRFTEKAKNQMKKKQTAGSTSISKKGPREAKNFVELYEQSQYRAEEGWNGIPSAAIRSSMIDACRTVGYKMTHAKLAIFVEQDGIDAKDGIPLFRIIGEPKMFEKIERNETGVADIRVRPMWRRWHAKPRIRFDTEMFTLEDVSNLLSRAGMQVGIGEGRPNSRKSYGIGWGLFRIAEDKEKVA